MGYRLKSFPNQFTGDEDELQTRYDRWNVRRNGNLLLRRVHFRHTPLRLGYMMRHFKFVGGPWDGEYHEVDSEFAKRGYLHVKQPQDFQIMIPPPEGMEETPVYTPLEHTTYTLRHFAGADRNVYYFADSKWSDIYVISQLVHHYLGRP